MSRRPATAAPGQRRGRWELAKRASESGEGAVGGGGDRNRGVDGGRGHCGSGSVGSPDREEELLCRTVLVLGLDGADVAFARGEAAVARAIDVDGEFAHPSELTAGAGLYASRGCLQKCV